MARYITRRMTLTRGFDANDIQVRFTAYRPNDAEIDVYFKVISINDADDFDNKTYTKMNLTSETDIDSENLNDFREYIYVPTISPITYTNANGIEFADFHTIAIKVVLRSTGQCYYRTPKVRDLKVLALAP